MGPPDWDEERVQEALRAERKMPLLVAQWIADGLGAAPEDDRESLDEARAELERLKLEFAEK